MLGELLLGEDGRTGNAYDFIHRIQSKDAIESGDILCISISKTKL